MTIVPDRTRQLPLVEKKRVVCPHDCPDTCLMNATVQDGRVIKVEGDEEMPFTGGFLCVKTRYYQERIYSPIRITTPLKRVGAKGAGEFTPISWDEALTTIAARFKAIIAEHSAEAILPFSYAGNMGKLAYASMDRRFFHYMGASLLDRTICSTAGGVGYTYTMGAKIGTDPETVGESKLIIAWGANPVSSNVHLMPFINEARKRGAKFVVVDPHRSKTAEQADLVIQPYPGTDAALALGMMRVIINENLYDKAFVEQHTFGFELLRQHVQQFTPEHVEAITGVNATQMIDFARMYAAIKPSFIRLNYGLNRHTNGGMMVRTVACLPALVGAWGVPGGGALLSTGGDFPLNLAALERTDLLNRHPKRPRTINMIKLGEALLEYSNPRVMGLYVYNCNPASVVPNLTKVIKGLEREDLFTVVHEQVMTDSARYADIVLPAPTTFEDTDIFAAYGHLYVQLNRPAINPVGESKPNIEVFRLLAERMDYEDPCFNDSAEDMIRQALASKDPRLEGITYERLEKESFARLNLPRPYVPFADGKYPTPSGKIEFYSEKMLRDGLDPLPNHNPSAESADGSPELFSRYPIRLVTPAAHHFLNSSFADMPTMLKKQRFPTLELNSSDAAERGIQNGDWLRAFNDRGQAYFVAEVGDSVTQGVACHLSIWWNSRSPKGWNCNVLTSDAEADMGKGATFHTNLVQVELASRTLTIAEIAAMQALYERN
ncbi:MAG: molybdopterin oxidoreductase family protein [Chloroflexi bacterium]|uniref:Molybdopterin oxidoreductase family protein n=1 Tax=Candidatus Chlorohelix allophototropha TaxID=3003348 RepID=A0A8T7M5C8_9CHLR|nr:molybdopterin oxidoreductase family protein [Chloroflexota bacterium]WJW69229.1 molybdopterin oxidoreductase family protein [Chloroflexota bacterium L227-S17]